MLRFDTLESRDTPAVVVDLAIDFAAGAVVSPTGTLQIRELELSEPRAFYTLGPGGLALETLQPVAGANDAVVLTRDADGAVTIRSADGVYGRVKVFGVEVLAYLGHEYAVHGANAVNVDMQLGGSDVVVNGTGLSAAISGGAGDDILVGGSAVDVLVGGAGADLYLGVDRGGDFVARDPFDVLL
jgi:hypothetical protein